METTKFIIIIISMCVSLPTTITLFVIALLKYGNDKRAEQERQKKELADAISKVSQIADQHLEERVRKIDNDIHEINVCLKDITSKVSEHSMIVSMFENYVRTTVAQSLKTWDTEPEKDVLLSKFAENRLTLDEAWLLKEYLIHERDEKIKSDKSIFGTYAATIIVLGLTIQRLELERKKDHNEPCDIA